MKKLITIISIALAATLLSSCIIVHPDDDVLIEKTSSSKSSDNSDETNGKYCITVKNETDTKVSKWWVKTKDTMMLPNSTLDRSIGTHKEDKIEDLPEGYYVVYFIFEGGYENYETITLDKDVIYCLSGSIDNHSVVCHAAK